MQERREAPRQKSLLKGRIFFNNRLSSVDCIIRDISATGARLQFPATTATPDVVELFIPHKDQTLRAQVRWRKTDEMGVGFVASDQAKAIAPTAVASPAMDISQRVNLLEIEVKDLRRVVTDIRQELRKLSRED
jgi:hypothetical protein